MAQKKNKVGAVVGSISLLGIALILGVAAGNMSSTIAKGLGGYSTTVINSDTAYTVEGNYLDGFEASVNILSEGTVLLKNENNILPLKDSTKVTLMGAGAYNYIIGGTGSAGGKDDEYTISEQDAFEEAGLVVNDKVWSNLEKACGGTRNAKSKYGNSEFTNFVQGKDEDAGWTSYKKVHEFSVDVWKNNIADSSSIGKYNEYAIVTLSRSGAEGASPSMDYDGDGSTTTGTTYLELSTEEKDLLKYCKDTFTHTIVLINSSAQMELGFLDSEEYGIDAALWIGHPGEAGMVGVGYCLTGLVSPSGRLADTYAYDMTTNPTYYNTDDNRYANANNQTFYQYEEGIYVGYRYYETADAEGYFDSDAFKATKFKGTDGSSATAADGTKTGQVTYSGYDEVVQYPFGYGLSYTTFSEEITSSNIDLALHGTNSITVRVKNTGSVAGKKTVQLYMEAPYNKDSSLGIKGKGLEKSKVVLVGYAKTSELAAGDSEEVTITFKTDDLVSFDNFGQGCYVLEKGEYKFNIQEDAHHWKDSGENKYTAQVKKTLDRTYIYNDSNDGARDSDVTAATNCMDDVTAGDGCMLDGYLSRSDFASGIASIMEHESNETPNENCSDAVASALATTGTDVYNYTFSTYKNGVKTSVTEKIYAYGSNAAPWMTELPNGTTIDQAKYAQSWGKAYYVVVDSNNEIVMTKESSTGELDDFDFYESENDVPSDIRAMGSSVRKVTIDDMGLVDASDKKWDLLTNMITIDEAITIQGDCGWSTPKVESVGKSAITAQDGPGEPNNGGSDMVTWYPSATTIAATWNTDLAYDYGKSYGQWEVTLSIGAAYAPAMNMHRSPFGGRNFEYYSEDGVLSGYQGGNAVAGIESTGTSVFIKHFALNDGDTNRGGNTTWANEQAIREIYLKTYEITCKEFEADGIMGSLNRIGMSWAHYGMYTTVLRDEWGWNGHLITDGDGTTAAAYNNPVFWLAGCQGSILNNGCYVNADATKTAFGTSAYESNFGQYLLHQTAKHCLYQYGNSGKVEGYMAYWWVGILVAVDVVLVLGAAAIIVFSLVLPALKGKKQN